MEWQPISEAPKDGTMVLLYGGVVDTVWYDDGAPHPPQVVGWFSRKYGDEDVWHFCSFDGGTYGEYENPSHFMPLPEPPKE